MLIRKAVFLDTYDIVELLNINSLIQQTHRGFISTFNNGIHLVSVENDTIASYMSLIENKRPTYVNESPPRKTFEITEFVLNPNKVVDKDRTAAELLKEVVKQQKESINIVYIENVRSREEAEEYTKTILETVSFKLLEETDVGRIFLFSPTP